MSYSLENPVDTEIVSYMHCMTCLKTKPQDIAPRDYARLEIGMNENGQIVIKCVRHDEKVLTVLDTNYEVQPCGCCDEDIE